MKSNRKYLFLFNILIFIFISFLYILFHDYVFFVKYILSLCILISIIFMVIFSKEKYGNIINFYSLMIICFYVFCCVRQITFFFGKNSYSSIYYNASIVEYGLAYYYSYVCIFAFFISIKLKNVLIDRNNSIDDISCKRIYNFFRILFWICFIPLVWYYYKLISVSFVYSYGSRDFDNLTQNTGYIVSLLRQYGVQSLLVIQILKFQGNQKVSRFYSLIFYFIVIISLLSGSRTEGLGLLLVIVLLTSNRAPIKKQKLSFKKLFPYLMAVLIIILIPYIYELRKNINNFSNISIFDYLNFDMFFSALHELGGSEAPLLAVMNSNSVFLHGKSYFLAFLNTIFNFLPSSIRPDFSFIGPISLASFYSRFLNLNYGLGFSLNAESFINFGWFGCVVFAVFGVVFSKIYNNIKSYGDYIIKVLLLFLLFTMPRRESKDLFTAILYYWLPFAFLIKYIFKKGKMKNNDKIQSEQ